MKKLLFNSIILSLGIGFGLYLSSKFDFLKEVETKPIKLPIISSIESIAENDMSKPKDMSSNLVNVPLLYSDFIIDLQYATNNNITNSILYPSPLCYLQKNTLDKLIKANEEFKTHGYKIKIWDAYRPFDVQKKLWSVLPDSRYIANPFKNGSNHNRGAAVDITLVTLDGKEVEMPTGFDDFSEKAHRTFISSKDVQKNVKLLTDIMIKHGFTIIQTEWWHFDDKDALDYPLLNHNFNTLLKK